MRTVELCLAIIAACEVIRAFQNHFQISMLRRDQDGRQDAYREFVKSLKQTDQEFVRRLMEEFEENGSDGES